MIKPLYILNHYSDDVRQQRATHAEIRAVVDGESDDRLAYVDLGPDGDLVATPVTADELLKIATNLDGDRGARFRMLLDSAVDISRKGQGFGRGIGIGSISVVTIWVSEAPWAEHLAEAWASERGLKLKRSSPPRSGTSWYPDAEVVSDGVTVVRLVWPSVEINTDKAIDEEIAVVSAERETAVRELEAF